MSHWRETMSCVVWRNSLAVLPPRWSGQFEPVEAMSGKGEHVGQHSNLRELHPTGQLDGGPPFEATQVELHGLWKPREVVDAEHDIVAELADVAQHGGVAGADLVVGPEPECRMLLPYGDHAPGPMQQ